MSIPNGTNCEFNIETQQFLDEWVDNLQEIEKKRLLEAEEKRLLEAEEKRLLEVKQQEIFQLEEVNREIEKQKFKDFLDGFGKKIRLTQIKFDLLKRQYKLSLKNQETRDDIQQEMEETKKVISNLMSNYALYATSYELKYPSYTGEAIPV